MYMHTYVSCVYMYICIYTGMEYGFAVVPRSTMSAVPAAELEVAAGIVNSFLPTEVYNLFLMLLMRQSRKVQYVQHAPRQSRFRTAAANDGHPHFSNMSSVTFVQTTQEFKVTFRMMP